METQSNAKNKKLKFNYDVSVIIPIYNGEKWIDECFEAILNQTAQSLLHIEVCVCNDASNDKTDLLLEKWKHIFHSNNIHFVTYNNPGNTPRGVGFGKNKACEISTGIYLCFQDVDDRMLPDRILKQYEEAKCLPNTVLLGSKFMREPPESTIRYTKWANSLTEKQLIDQIYTSHGPTIIMPTWFCHRDVFQRVGGFSEEGKGTPEDLIFFYKHLDLGGCVVRTNNELLIYRYHPEATTFSIKEETIWNLRIKRLELKVISQWSQFTIWNAGKQGRKFYKSLTKDNQNKVMAICDVDKKKIGKFYVPFDETTRTVGRKIEIVHFKEAQKPFIICVKLDMTSGIFEHNLQTLNLKEGTDFVLFS